MAQLFTPIPGDPLPDAERALVRRAFMDRFVDATKRHLPFWFSFPLNAISRELFCSADFKALRRVYVLLGKGHAIHTASGVELSEFFMHQDPDDDMAIYVFDPTYTWCVCSTDRLTPDARPGAPDFLTIGVGELPGSHSASPSTLE